MMVISGVGAVGKERVTDASSPSYFGAMALLYHTTEWLGSVWQAMGPWGAPYSRAVLAAVPTGRQSVRTVTL